MKKIIAVILTIVFVLVINSETNGCNFAVCGCTGSVYNTTQNYTWSTCNGDCVVPTAGYAYYEIWMNGSLVQSGYISSYSASYQCQTISPY